MALLVKAALSVVLLLGLSPSVGLPGDGPQPGAQASAAVGAGSAGQSRAAARACTGPRGEPGGPDSWGGCWPGPASTGVPSGTALTSYSGDRTVSTRGAVVDGWDVSGCIVVTALDVTIQNSRAGCVHIEGQARYCRTSESSTERSLTGCTAVPSLGRSRAGRWPRTLVKDSEIRCPNGPGESGFGDRNLRILRVEVTHCENGFSLDSFVTVKDSYVHDLYNAIEGDPHTDGTQVLVGRSVRLKHNVFHAFSPGCSYPSDANCNGSSAVTFGGQPDYTSVIHSSVQRNLLAGGSYTLYCPIARPRNFSVVDNRFSEVYGPKVGEYGPSDGCHRSGVTWRGNKRIDY